jgi:plasmid stabilization system protein ParE
MAVAEFHPRAVEEARATRRWYARVSQNLADQFMAELDAAVARIEANPQGFSPHLHGTRVCRLNRFPYQLVFLEVTPDRVLILAVAHNRRRPGYWRRRLP